MRGYARMAVVSSLIVGLLAVPNLSSATDQDGNRRHSLLNAELRSKIERLRDKIEDHRERHHNNQGGSAGSLQALQTEVANLKTALADMVNHQASLLAQLTTANARLSALEKNGTGGNPTDPVLVELIKYVKVDTNPVNASKDLM